MTKSILCPGARMGIFQHPVKALEQDAAISHHREDHVSWFQAQMLLEDARRYGNTCLGLVEDLMLQLCHVDTPFVAKKCK